MKVLVKVLFLILLEAINAQFLEQPNAGTVFISAQDQVTFTCSVEEGYLIDWHIAFANGEHADAANGNTRRALMQRGVTFEGEATTKSTLSLREIETQTNNGTNITCLALLSGSIIQTLSGNTAQVIFYHAPLSPTDLSVTRNILGSLNIFWSLEFIEGVPVNYTLTVLNLNTTSAQPIIIAGLLDQHYVFETSRPCDVYSFTVTAVTAAGNSTPSQEIIYSSNSSEQNMCSFTTREYTRLMTTFQPTTNSSLQIRDIILIGAASVVVAIAIIIMLMVVCACCFKKITAVIKSSLAGPMYENPGDVASAADNNRDPVYETLGDKSSTDNHETPFIMTLSSAYGVSINPKKLPVKTSSVHSTISFGCESPKSADISVPFAMTSSAAYGVSLKQCVFSKQEL